MDDRILKYIWLSDTLYPGSPIAKVLFEKLGTIEKIYDAEKEDYRKLGLHPTAVRVLCEKDLSTAKEHLKYCKSENIGFLCYEDRLYPERLKVISNPPPLFYYRGRLNNLDDLPCFTMVGTRSCSEKGFRLAYETAFDAASKGAVIVNGLALGIDGACIAGALDANGYAVGILGCGIDRIYPQGNKDLFYRLSASGLILTEFPPFTKPDAKNFPVRNRVLSGLSLATVVFEAELDKSGALLTAEHAEEQGRRIFAVPGKPYDKNYSGPLELIKNGATVFTEADDLLLEYSMNYPHRINTSNINTPPTQKLDGYVAKYFKKGTDPEAPVNRRYVHSVNTEKDTVISQEASVQKQEKTVKQEKLTCKQEPPKPAVQDQPKAEVQKGGFDISVLAKSEQMIYKCLLESKEPITPNQLVDMGFKIEEVLSSLTLLEIYTLVKALPGGRYTAN